MCTPAAAPNLSTIAEPRGLVHDTDTELSECIAALMQAQKDGGPPPLARHVTMAELRLWKRDYMQLLDLADVRQAQRRCHALASQGVRGDLDGERGV